MQYVDNLRAGSRDRLRPCDARTLVYHASSFGFHLGQMTFTCGDVRPLVGKERAPTRSASIWCGHVGSRMGRTNGLRCAFEHKACVVGDREIAQRVGEECRNPHNCVAGGIRWQTTIAAIVLVEERRFDASCRSPSDNVCRSAVSVPDTQSGSGKSHDGISTFSVPPAIKSCRKSSAAIGRPK